MNTRLSEPQIRYVLEHIGHHVNLHTELTSLFRFGEEAIPGSSLVFFPLSEEELNIEKVIMIGFIPVLYPVGERTELFFTLQGKSLVFHHDILKSAFHLLSGYEEFKSGESDSLGRFPYKSSLQYRLGIVTKPVVNYYIEAILDGLDKFCKVNGIPFERRPALKRPMLMLSHDIDRIDAYHFFETGFKFKQLLGLAPSPYSRVQQFRVAFSALYHLLNPFSRKNPFWNFDFLNESASARGFRSTFFFLEREGAHENSRYHFNEKRIRGLMQELTARGHEIGLHGTIRSADRQVSMDLTLKNLQEASPEPVRGIRQHFLKYRLPDTSLIQENAGLVYDTSLGFAEHEGFRNSYCWPFRLYDFRTDRSMELWEIPLTMMDVTLFYYRNMDYTQIIESVEKITDEVVRFNGVCTLLWHNSFFDEMEFPGITEFYLRLLDFFKSKGLIGIPGTEILDQMAT